MRQRIFSWHSISVLAGALLISDFGQAAEKIEWSELHYNVVRAGDSTVNVINLIDNNLATGILIPAAQPADQYVQFDSTAYQDFTPWARGVLFHTYEKQMTSGTVKFYVDGVECPDTAGVGENALGGVFNCDLRGRMFEARCVDVCEPYLAIQEIKVWTKTALTATGHSAQVFEGNEEWVTHPVQKAFGLGSYVQDAWDNFLPLDIAAIGRGTTERAGVNYFWQESARVQRVIQWVQQPNIHSGLRIELANSLMTGTYEGEDIVSIYRNDGNAPHFVSLDTDMYRKNVAYWRAKSWVGTWLTRGIVIGTFCSEADTSDDPLQSDWSTPAQWTVKEPGTDIQQIASARYTRCGGDTVWDNASQMSFQFSDWDKPEVSFNDWIYTTVEDDTHYIVFDPTVDVISAYSNQIVKVKITATDPDGASKDELAQFYIEDYVGLICRASYILPPPAPLDLLATVFDPEPLVFTLEQAFDTGTLELQQTPGFETETCGTFTFTQQTLHMLVEQESDLQYAVQTDDRAAVGRNILQLLIESVKYPNYISPLVFDIDIEVIDCLAETLLPSEGSPVFSPLYMIFGLPYEETIQLPLFEPFPACGYSSDDIEYAFVGEPPKWLIFDENSREVRAETNDAGLLGQTILVQIRASFSEDLSEDIDFAFVFQGEAVEPQPRPVPQEQQDSNADEDEQPVIQNETDSEPDGGWDGWKSLLLKELNLGENFKLPKPITTPGYVPTPPTAKLDRVSVQGQTTIKFSEDVFILPDLEKQKIKVPRRKLESAETTFEFEYDERPFIEIKVEPGYMSDPTKLDFTYSVSFKDARTISIKVNFKTPTYVSANQPEDVLVVTLWGPFYDQQDGLEIPITKKTIRQTIPPQVMPGSITAAIESAGDSLQTGSLSILAGNAVINTVLAGSLNQVWGMVNNLQTIIHSPLINVQFPGNAFLLYEVMIQVATFDILPTDDIFPYFFTELPELDAFTDKFDRLNYGSMFIIMNLGTMLLVFIYYSILYMVYPCMKFASQRGVSRATKFYKSLSDQLFWSHSIVFLQEGFIDILISGVINLVYIGRNEDAWSNWNLVFSNLIAIFLLVASSILTLFTLYLWTKQSKLSKSQYKNKFGSIYETVDVRRNNWTMLFPVLFFARRIVFVVSVVALIDYPVFQLYIFLLSALVTMAILGVVEPFKNRAENRLEIYNSFTILLLSYCLLSFTPFVLDADARYQVGYGMVLLTIQNIVFNIFIIGRDPVRKVYLRCRRNWLRRRTIKRNLQEKTARAKLYLATSLRRIKTKLGVSQTQPTEATNKTQFLQTIEEDSDEAFNSDGDDGTMKTDEMLIQADRKQKQKELKQKATEMLEQIKQRQADRLKQTQLGSKVDQVFRFYLMDTHDKRSRNKPQPEVSSASSSSDSSSSSSDSETSSNDSVSSDVFRSHQGSLHKKLVKAQSRSLSKLKRKARDLSSQGSARRQQKREQSDRRKQITVQELGYSSQPSSESIVDETILDHSHKKLLIDTTKLPLRDYLQVQNAAMSPRTLSSTQSKGKARRRDQEVGVDDQLVRGEGRTKKLQNSHFDSRHVTMLNMTNTILAGSNNEVFYSNSHRSQHQLDHDEVESQSRGHNVDLEAGQDVSAGVLGMPKKSKKRKNEVLMVEAARELAQTARHNHPKTRFQKKPFETREQSSAISKTMYSGGFSKKQEGADSNLSKQELRQKVINNLLKGFDQQEKQKQAEAKAFKKVNEVPLPSDSSSHEERKDDSSVSFDFSRDNSRIYAGSNSTKNTAVQIARTLQKISHILK